ncbi:hypothetical protein CRG98_024186 [Punica granatum]|uniref:Uncharacterized protein n=1 Tax=Punica granatum TaxID=22663 RepID=A0A2I0JHD1_PUNGR|nr:hypothetical protein CRG98_024186 [Punica granatum]
MPTCNIVVPNQFATIQSRLAVLLDLRDEEIRHELRYGWEHSVRTAWLIDFIHIHSLNTRGESYQHDACHGFLLLIFGTILFPYSSNLIDGALAQRRIVLHTASCGKFDVCGTLASFRNFTSWSIPLMVITTGVPSIFDSCMSKDGVPIGHPPPTAQTASNFVNLAHFTALEGMVNHLATNVATNMTELMAMLGNQN